MRECYGLLHNYGYITGGQYVIFFQYDIFFLLKQGQGTREGEGLPAAGRVCSRQAG